MLSPSVGAPLPISPAQASESSRDLEGRGGEGRGCYTASPRLSHVPVLSTPAACQTSSFAKR